MRRESHTHWLTLSYVFQEVASNIELIIVTIPIKAIAHVLHVVLFLNILYIFKKKKASGFFFFHFFLSILPQDPKIPLFHCN